MEPPDRLREHDITLRGDRVVLRPMRATDWDAVARWNRDPEVLYFSDGDDATEYSLAEVQAIYRTVSQTALVFIIELDGAPIGDCWLQRMNLPRISDRFPRHDLRRIDLEIGEKALWSKGLGTEIIKLLVAHAFEQERADAVFACDVADYNPRSRRAFEKCGFTIDRAYPQPPGRKANTNYDLVHWNRASNTNS